MGAGEKLPNTGPQAAPVGQRDTGNWAAGQGSAADLGHRPQELSRWGRSGRRLLQTCGTAADREGGQDTARKGMVTEKAGG